MSDPLVPDLNFKAPEPSGDSGLNPHRFFPFPTIRPAQDRALNAWMKVVNGDKRFAVFELPTGVGKCLAPGTPVMLYSGEVVPVESVAVGDLLMGPDSRPRRVLSLARGQDAKFRVTPTKGESYVVNSQHLLALKMTTTRRSPNRRAEYSGEVVILSVADYLQRSNYFKHCAKGFRTGVDFPQQEVPLDPYFLGLWLGDGTAARPEITTMEPEILAYLETMASALGLVLTPWSNGSKATAYHLTTGRRGGSGGRNPLVSGLKTLGVFKNKHVPHIYKANSRQVRLELLAGYLDTDGEAVNGGFSFVAKNQQLAQDIQFLARSLGFACYTSHVQKASQQGTQGVYIYGHISGDTSVIPVRVARKHTLPRTQKKDPLKVGIRVSPEGMGAYYGFTLDGDGLFLLGDFTVTHNSGIAYAIGGWAAAANLTPDAQAGAYVLTTQKSLQTQYLRDFGNRGMVELKGAVNYRCGDQDTDCQAGRMLHKANRALIQAKRDDPNTAPEDLLEFEAKHPIKCGTCAYETAKGAFRAAPLGVTNFSYMLAESKHVRSLRPRNVLIIDEAHNTESQLLSFVEIEITVQRADQVGAPNPPRIKPGEIGPAREWVLTVFRPLLIAWIKALQMELLSTDSGDRRTKISSRIAAGEQFASRLDFLADAEQMDEWFAYSDEKTGALKLRPLTARCIAEDYLFRMGVKLLFLSATILDGKAFIKGLGLNGTDGGFLRVDSDFPVENRLIHFYPAGSMSFKNIENTTPKLLNYVERILNKHGDERGIIHTHSYKLTQAVVEHLRGTKHASRIITHDSMVGSRDRAIHEHVTSTEPTVLVSPSMTEGLDLSEDLSRFQVLSKVPFPYLGDPFVKARMAHDDRWYTWTTALSLVQATGRSIRSSTDRATTYMLDADFNSFMARASDILPAWWKAAIVDHGA